MSESDNSDHQQAADNADNEGQAAQPTEENPQSNLGRIEWLDLTVSDATRLRNFYKDVVGWQPQDVDMGAYADFNMTLPDSNETIAGICHAKGMNSNMPPQWLVYVRVADVQESAELCLQKGGKILDGPKRMGNSNFCVIEDPAGAVMALLSERKVNRPASANDSNEEAEENQA
jgi:hypothetical protein